MSPSLLVAPLVARATATGQASISKGAYTSFASKEERDVQGPLQRYSTEEHSSCIFWGEGKPHGSKEYDRWPPVLWIKLSVSDILFWFT